MIAFIQSLPGPIAQGIIWGMMAIGVFLTFRILDFADLTVDGSFATGGAVLALTLSSGMNVYFAMLFAFLAGCLAGLATGIFNTVFGIPPILAGILTQLALYSINLRILGGKANQAVSARNYNLIISIGSIKQTLIIGLVISVIIIAVLYWFFGTELGHSIRATGNNQNMARANGINTNVNKVIALVLSNGIVAFSGALLAQYQGFADVSMGKGAIVTGLAAVIIGEVVFGKLFKNFSLKLFACILGGIVYYIVIAAVLKLGLNANDLKLLSALVVAVFLGVPYWKSRVVRKKIKGGAENA